MHDAGPILIPDVEDPRLADYRRRVLAGQADFAALAREHSQDGSSKEGGDLGWANPAGFVKPFADALTKLEKGKYTATPVKTDFGYHVIKLDDSRALKAPTFDEVKAQLKQRIEKQRVDHHVAELRAKATIK